MHEVSGAVYSQWSVTFANPSSELFVSHGDADLVYYSINSLFKIPFVCVHVYNVSLLYNICTLESVITFKNLCTPPFISFLYNRLNIFECDIKGCFDSCPTKPFLPGILLKIFTVGAWLWCLFVEINSRVL